MKLLFLFLLSWSAYAGQYDEALNKAKDAFLIQTGAQQFINQVNDYASNEGQKIIRKCNLEKPSGIVFISYKIYRDKSITFPISQNKQIGLQLNQINLTVKF